MNLSRRFGFGRKGKGAPDAADDAAPALSSAAAAEKSVSPLDALPLSQEDRRLADELFGSPPAVAPKPAVQPAPRPAVRIAKTRKKMDRGDLTIGALGVTLGLTCALFPWYIFFNQEQFGVREFTFDGSRDGTPARHTAYQPQLIGKPFQTGEVPMMELDVFPTATVPEESETTRPLPASEQPFPPDIVNFRLVHVANGRAMIQDDDGLWVVQPGSRLPNASVVSSIEKRDGSWVLVTSHDTVIALDP